MSAHASNPCSACSVPVHGPALPSVAARCRGQRSDACCSQGISLRDSDTRRSSHHPAPAMAAPVPESRACAYSTPRRRAGRLACALPSPALPPPGPTRRRSSRAIWCPCERGCAGPRGTGKPLQIAVDSATGTTGATQATCRNSPPHLLARPLGWATSSWWDFCPLPCLPLQVIAWLNRARPVALSILRTRFPSRDRELVQPDCHRSIPVSINSACKNPTWFHVPVDGVLVRTHVALREEGKRLGDL